MAKLKPPRFSRFMVVACFLLITGYGAGQGLERFERSMLYYPVPGERTPAADGPPIQVVRLTTVDDEELVAWWLPPAEGRPTILYFNGNGDSLAAQEGRWRRMADAGVGFLAVAYRGYDGSTGSPSEKGLHRDARAAYAWLNRRVISEDIVIHGFSLGSGVAVNLAAEHEARALILEAPFTAAVDVAAEIYPWLPAGLLMKDQYRSRDLIGGVKMPVLIVHGDADSVIPFAQGQQLFSMAPQPKQFVRMPGSDHNTLTRDGLYDHIWTFLGVPFEGSTAYPGRPAPSPITHED